MTPLLAEPFFLLDESLSRNIVAGVSAATGYSIATVWDEWPGRNLPVNPLPDEAIIPHLGAKGGCRAVWITADLNARRRHRRLLEAQQISVLWLLGPGNRNLGVAEQRRTLIAVLGTAHRIVAATAAPVYLRARYDGQPMLERWGAARLGEHGQRWVAVPLG